VRCVSFRSRASTSDWQPTYSFQAWAREGIEWNSIYSILDSEDLIYLGYQAIEIQKKGTEMGATLPFTLDETHGLTRLPGCELQSSSAELGWTSLFVSTQLESPFEAAVEPVSDHLLVFHLDGPVYVRGEVQDRHVRRLVPAGSLFLWPAGSGFRIQLEASVKTLHLYIRSSVVEEVAACLGYSEPDTVHIAPRLSESDELLEQLALEVGRAATSRTTSAQLYTDHLARAIAARLIRINSPDAFRGAAPPSIQGLTAAQLKRAQDYIEAHLNEVIRLLSLSEASGLSVSHFTRRFKVTTGLSPHQFVLRRRIEHAKRLLIHTNEAIAQIALRCGFSHQEHLTHTFKRFTGHTPGRYRQTVRS
jgi:AraC family transcriptional regulator